MVVTFDGLPDVLPSGGPSASSAESRHVVEYSSELSEAWEECAVMTEISTTEFDPRIAFGNFQAGLRRALKVSRSEMDARIAADNAQRDAERTQKGYKKRGPKPKKAR